MSECKPRPSSPAPSISLLEAKAETRLVLKSFLRQTLAASERPGRVGGEYHDPQKFSAGGKQSRAENGWDSVAEAICTAEEKKHSIKDLIKRRWQPKKKTAAAKPHGDPSAGQPEKGLSGTPSTRPKKLEQEDLSPSTSEDEFGKKKEGERKKKKKLFKPQLSGIFRSNKQKPSSESRPQKPTSLSIKREPRPVEPVASPSHPPEFYDGVASTLGRIAQHTVKRPVVTPPTPEDTLREELSTEELVQRLSQVLLVEAEAINEKIEGNEFLRSSLNRLSFGSFAKLVDACASQTEDPPLLPSASPTLRRMAATMEVSRRIITATAAPARMMGFAEDYVEEQFAPWVKNRGGWEKIVHMDEGLEYD